MDWEELEDPNSRVEDRLLKKGEMYREKHRQQRKDKLSKLFHPNVRPKVIRSEHRFTDNIWKGKTLQLIKQEESSLKQGLNNLLFPGKKSNTSRTKNSNLSPSKNSDSLENINLLQRRDFQNSFRYTHQMQPKFFTEDGNNEFANLNDTFKFDNQDLSFANRKLIAMTSKY